MVQVEVVSQVPVHVLAGLALGVALFFAATLLAAVSVMSTLAKPSDFARFRAAPLKADLVGNCVLPSLFREKLGWL